MTTATRVWSGALCVSLVLVSGSARAWKELEEVQALADAAAEGVIRNQEALIRRHASSLAGEDQKAAKAAIEFFAAMREQDIIAVALHYPADNIVVRAGKALEEVGDARIVPELLSALRTAGREVGFGGAEAVSWNRDVRRSLLAALAKTTKLELGEVDAASEASVRGAIETVEKWLADREKETIPQGEPNGREP